MSYKHEQFNAAEETRFTLPLIYGFCTYIFTYILRENEKTEQMHD